MVFFICDGCQETLKKSSVDKHANICRQCYSVTCVDCSKSFEGNDYAAHNVCISEAEKYEKSLYKPKNKAAKRDPQAEWTELIQNASVNPGGKYKDLLSRLTSYTNVPRKLKPFVNFAKNSLKMYNDGLLTDLFNYIQSLAPPRTQNNNNNANKDEDDTKEENDNEDTPSDKKDNHTGKRKRSNSDDYSTSKNNENSDNENTNTTTTIKSSSSKSKSDDFDFKDYIMEAVTKIENNNTSSDSSNISRLKLKRVKKQAIELAIEKLGLTEEDAEKKFEKKLAKLIRKEKVLSDDKFIWKA